MSVADGINWSAFRPGQERAVRVCLQRIAALEPYTAIILPTRYGKSDCMRCVSTLAVRDGLIATTLAMSPSDVLRGQMANTKKWREAFTRYGLSGEAAIATLSAIPRIFPGGRPTFTPNGEIFVSATTQIVNQNRGLFSHWVNSVLYSTGRPVLVHMDEAHMGGEDLEWGETVKALVSAGALAILWTATAMRSDGRIIPGFRFDPVGESLPVTIRRVRPGALPEKVWVDVYEGVKRLFKLRADHETTFADAWEERPSPLCKVGRLPFDVSLRRALGSKEEPRMLSELSSTDTRRVLGRLVRSSHVIEEGVRMLVTNLRKFREQTLPNAGGIIFCSNDRDEDRGNRNGHAHRIRAAIQRQAPDLSVVIATSADEGQPGKETIDRFIWAGIGDVLIVKQMASLGLDCDRLKVGLDLSPVRTPAAGIQRLMRTATPLGTIRHCVWITPADIIGEAVFQMMIGDEGGSMTATDLELARSFEMERKDRDEPAYSVDGTADADFEDTERNRALAEEASRVAKILDAFPALIGVYSHAEIAQRGRGLPEALLSPESGPEIRDTSVDAILLKEDINDTAAEIVRARLGDRYGRDEYQDVIRDTYRRAYQAAGIGVGVRLSDIRELPLLNRIKLELDRIRASLGVGHDGDG